MLPLLLILTMALQTVQTDTETPVHQAQNTAATFQNAEHAEPGLTGLKSWHEESVMTTFLPQQVKQIFGEEHAGRPLKILDYGCSTGLTTLSVAEVFPYSKLIGFDVDEKSIDEARKTVAEFEDFTSRVEFVSHLNKNLKVDGLSCLNASAGATSQELATQLDGLLTHVKPGGFLWVVFKMEPSKEVIQQLVAVLPPSDVNVLRSAEHALDQKSMDGKVKAPLYLGWQNHATT